MKLKFVPLDYDYFDFNGENIVRVMGRDEKWKRVCLLEKIEPYFFVVLQENVSEKRITQIQEAIERIRVENASRVCKVIKTEVQNKSFLGKKVKTIKIYITNYKDAHAVADEIDFPEILVRREYDINIITKYIIDRQLLPLQWHFVEGDVLVNSEEFGGVDNKFEVDYCIKVGKIGKCEDLGFKPKILAFDIEADEFEIGKGEIVMISLVSDKMKKVLTWKKTVKKQDFVEVLKDEAEMIERFIEIVRKENADLFAGYFSDGFDLQYLKARAEKFKIKLDLGLTNENVKFSRGRIASGYISGMIHVDLFRFIETVFSQYLQSETLGLNEVAQELLGEGKRDYKLKHSKQVKEEEWEEYFDYNLQDSVLTYKLAEKFWPDMLEFSKIIQEPLFEITRNSMSQLVEDYLLHNLSRFNEIAEKRPIYDEIESRKLREKYTRAFVFKPTPGLYEDLAIFDFTSMHASVIVSFNLSKSTLLGEKTKDGIESPEMELEGEKKKFYFSKEPGFFPLLLK